MKKIIALLLAAFMLLSLAACGKKEPEKEPDVSQTGDDAKPDKTPETPDAPDVPADESADSELVHNFSQFGNARIAIVGSEFVQNDDGEDILRVYYDYTNTEKVKRGHYPSTALNFLSVTQDGEECLGYSFIEWSDEAYISEDVNCHLYVQPGCTMRNTVCFRCDPKGGPVKFSSYVMVGSWLYDADTVETFDFEIDPANLMGAPEAFKLPPITDPTYTDGASASGIFGIYDSEVSINGVELTRDYDGETVVRVKLTVTNNGDESMTPALICDLELYQDGIGLPYPTTWDLEEPTAEDEAYEEDLYPGETVECSALFYLRNSNPVEAALEDPNGEVTIGACFDVQALLDAAAKEEQAAADEAAKAEAEARKAIVGTWLQRDSDWEDTYIFNDDGSGVLISGPEYPFTYSIDGETLFLNYGPDDEEEYTFFVDGDVLTLTDWWGDELVHDKLAGEDEGEPTEDEPEEDEPTLAELSIGTWEDQETEYRETFTFNADGTGVYGFEDGGYWEYTFTYDWYSGDYLEFIYDDDGTVGGFTVRIEGDVMYLTNDYVTDMPLVRK